MKFEAERNQFFISKGNNYITGNQKLPNNQPTSIYPSKLAKKIMSRETKIGTGIGLIAGIPILIIVGFVSGMALGISQAEDQKKHLKDVEKISFGLGVASYNYSFIM